MSETTAKVATTEAPKASGWGELVCPSCLEDVGVSVCLDALDVFFCRSCDVEFCAGDVRTWLEEQHARAKRWERVLAWLDSAPAVGG